MNLFVGPSGELDVKDADTQRSINLMPTLIESGGGKVPVFLKPVPGLTQFSTYLTLTLTSNLYPIYFFDGMDISHAVAGGQMFTWPLDGMDITHAFTAGVLLQPLKTYDLWPAEKMDITHSFDAGVLTVVLNTYSMPPENMDITHSFDSGVLTVILRTYSNWPAENMNITHAFVAGVLT